MDQLTRRAFLKVSAVAASSLVVSTGLNGCFSGSGDSCKHDCDSNTTTKTSASVHFLHGVASGDPLSDKVIIWTRATPVTAPASDQKISIDYEVAADAGFTDIVHNGSAMTDQSRDFTVKIDLHNLQPATRYYYRFRSGDTLSATGIAKTLPVEKPRQVKFALFTCANYPNGYFNAYDAASKIDDFDALIHVGDYIYEYGMYENDDFNAKVPAYATQNAEAIGRVLPADNNTELLKLEDYRKRHALYKTDPGLQAIHKHAPMIAVWDDHEFANDAWKEGAENHQSDEGAFSTRVEHALQAYFEWMPIRPVTDKKAIYRSFNFGNLVNLHMLETRILARSKQLDYSDYFSANGFDTGSFMTDLISTDRAMMGSTQLGWLQQTLSSSTGTWQVLGQQVIMGRMTIPAELLTLISQLDHPEAFGKTKEQLMGEIKTSIAELTSLKMRALQNDTTLTQQELARINTVLPYNLDAWDGYFAEREMVLGTAKALQKNLVVLSGDSHNSWANNLTDANGDQVGVEFATTSVTSPGLEAYLGFADVAESVQFEQALQLLIDDLAYTNTFDRGFIALTFTEDAVKAEYLYVDNYSSPQYNLNTQRSHTVTVKRENNTPVKIV